MYIFTPLHTVNSSIVSWRIFWHLISLDSTSKIYKLYYCALKEMDHRILHSLHSSVSDTFSCNCFHSSIHAFALSLSLCLSLFSFCIVIPKDLICCHRVLDKFEEHFTMLMLQGKQYSNRQQLERNIMLHVPRNSIIHYPFSVFLVFGFGCCSDAAATTSAEVGTSFDFYIFIIWTCQRICFIL